MPGNTDSSSSSRPLTNVPAPPVFSFKPDEWPRWRQRYDPYLIASRLKSLNDRHKINLLLHTMGVEAEDIFASFTWTTPTDKDSYSKVLEKFENHFIPKRNAIHEQCMFFQRTQQPNESVDDFITALSKHSEHADFGEMREILIRNFMVLGIRDSDLSKKMQLMPDLTLQKSMQTVRTQELVEKPRKFCVAFAKKGGDTSIKLGQFVFSKFDNWKKASKVSYQVFFCILTYTKLRGPCTWVHLLLFIYLILVIQRP